MINCCVYSCIFCNQKNDIDDSYLCILSCQNCLLDKHANMFCIFYLLMFDQGRARVCRKCFCLGIDGAPCRLWLTRPLSEWNRRSGNGQPFMYPAFQRVFADISASMWRANKFVWVLHKGVELCQWLRRRRIHSLSVIQWSYIADQ